MMKTKKLETGRIALFLAISFGWVCLLGLFAYLLELQNSPYFPVVLVAGYMLAPAGAQLFTRWLTNENDKGLITNPNPSQHLKQSRKYLFIPSVEAVGYAGYMSVQRKEDKGLLTIPTRNLYLIIFVVIAAHVIYPLLHPPQVFYTLQACLEDCVEHNKGVEILSFGTWMMLTLLSNFLNIVFTILILRGEELGWRAYLQPKLMPLGPRTATILVGFLWGVWYAPLMVMGHGYVLDFTHTTNMVITEILWAGWLAPIFVIGQNYILGILMVCWMCILLSIILGWGCMRTGSVWPAVIGRVIFTGIVGIVLAFVQGEPPTLLGPAIAGVVASLPMVPFALWLWASPAAWQAPLPTDTEEISFSADTDKEKKAVAPEITFSSD